MQHKNLPCAAGTSCVTTTSSCCAGFFSVNQGLAVFFSSGFTMSQTDKRSGSSHFVLASTTTSCRTKQAFFDSATKRAGVVAPKRRHSMELTWDSHPGFTHGTDAPQRRGTSWCQPCCSLLVKKVTQESNKHNVRNNVGLAPARDNGSLN